MKKKVINILDILVKSVLFVFVNYILSSIQMSFKASFLAFLASISNVWMILDYYTSIQSKTNSRFVTVLLIVICFVAKIIILYYFGYIKGTIDSF